MHVTTKPRMTAQEFLAWDATQIVRHEFVAGQLRVLHGEDEPQLAGTGEAHVTAALNVAMALRQHLAGSPCRTFISDMKLRVQAADAYFYPDVMVTCSERDAADPLVKREPVLLVEVLSPATAAFDRGDKFAAYRTLPTLREVLLVDPDTRRCDLYRLGDQGLWVLHPSAPGAGLRLASVERDIGADALWAQVPAPQR